MVGCESSSGLDHEIGHRVDAALLLLSLGNLIYVSAALIKGQLRFRAATILAGAILAVWGAVTSNWANAAWNSAFVVINAVQTIRIMQQNAIELLPHEEEIRAELFSSLDNRDFLTLWTAGAPSTATRDELLCQEGVAQGDVMLLLSGDVRVTSSGGLDVTRAAPSFIGEMSFLTGAPASADVRTADEVEIRRWDKDDLRNLIKLNPNCEAAWQYALGVDVATKLGSL